MTADLRLDPVPAAGADPLPGLLAARAKDLLQAQLGKYLAAAPSRRSQAAAGVDALREAVSSVPDDDLTRAVLHPLFSQWSVRERAAAQPSPSTLHLSRILLAPLITRRLLPDRGLWVPVSGGELRGPGLQPLALPAGPAAHVRLDGDGVTFRTGTGHIELAAAEVLGGGVRPLPEADLVLDAADPWLRGFLDQMNAQPRVGPYPKRDLRPLINPGQDIVATYREVLNLLQRSWPEAYDELLRYTRVVVPFESRHMLGWATPLFQGAVFVRAAPGNHQFTFERIVHEAAHLRLFSIQRVGKLHTDTPGKRLISPARRDPRPVSGVYHAAFVYGRLSEAFARVIRHGADEGWERRFGELRAKYWILSRTLRAEAALTPLGEDLLSALDQRVALAAGGPAPDERKS